MNQRQAIPCRWPGGCQLTTTDPSGFCHNHRRFSANVWSESGELLRGARLQHTMMRANHSQDAFLAALERSQAFVQARPEVVVNRQLGYALVTNQPQDSVYWNGQLTPLPVRVEGKIEVSRVSDGVTCFQFSNPKDLEAHVPKILGSARQMYHEVTSRVYGLSNHAGEWYDDPAEALAQLNLVGDAPGFKVSLSSLNNVESFRVSGPQFFVAGNVREVLVAEALDDQPDGQRLERLSVRFIPERTSEPGPSRPEDEQVANQVVQELCHLRTVIHWYGVPSNGQLCLPVGWSDL